jgi:hypothetical protein
MRAKKNKAIMTLAICMLFSVLGTSISSSECQRVTEEKIIGEWLDKYLVKNPNPRGIRDRYLGEYEEQLTLTQEGNKFFLTSNKGRSNLFELIEVPAQPGEKRRFNEMRRPLWPKDRPDDFFTGKYYVIDANGNLDLYDKNGYIREAKKIG